MMPPKYDIMFIHESLPDNFRELFFGPFDSWDKIETFSDRETMAHLIARTGMFPSATQAAKNGWAKPIPEGFTAIQHRKKRRDIFILNIFPGWQE